VRASNFVKKRYSIYRLAFSLLPNSDKKKVVITTATQASLSILDLIGIAMIGALGALAVVGIQSSTPGDRVSKFLRILHLDSLSFQSQIALLGGLSALVFLLKTLISLRLVKRILKFLSLRSAMVSTELTGKLLSQSVREVDRKSSQEMIYTLTSGVNSVLVGIIGSTINFVADLCLLFLIFVALLYVDPMIASVSLFVFLGIGYFLYKTVSARTHNLGMKFAELTILANQRTVEIFKAYRELFTNNNRFNYISRIESVRRELAEVQAEMIFIPNISKYVIESAVVVGALVISASQFVIQDARHAIGTLVIFLTAGTRLAPAILRLQQGAVQIKSSLGSALPTLELISKLNGVPSLTANQRSNDFSHTNFNPEISISGLCFQFDKKSRMSIQDLSIEIPKFEILGIAGASGAGKSTLLDLIIGVLEPTSGTVTISNFAPAQAINHWPGAIAYIPQEVTLAMATIRENIALGFPPTEIDDARIFESLDQAQLLEFVSSLPHGLDTLIGEGGLKISGGERQRIGIARALYTNPKLLILDEATSALDGETESNIIEAIYGLRGKVTMVLVAHRISTLKKADRIIYFEDGSIRSLGTFEEIQRAIPEFDPNRA
jgi:ABC-type multidrug transport system fused ATPase/permease subunit